MDKTTGRRLERFVKARWTRDQGGIRALAKEIGAVPETLYSWFRGDTEPSLEALGELGRVLGVSRSAIVAAMDGEGPAVPIDEDLVALIDVRLAAALDARLGRGRG
jgi:DNA-binding XRE family transcriptional regulator